MGEHLGLIVEDDVFLADIFQTALSLAGFKVEVFNDGISALARLAQITPNMLILDLNLPGTPGIQILSQIRRDKKLRQLPVLVVSANIHLASFLETQPDPHLQVLQKPVTITQLVKHAKEIKANLA